MQQRRLGSGGPLVGAIGFGAMGLSGVYGPVSDAEGLVTLERVLELGMSLIDTADIYGDGHNERLVGRLAGEFRALAAELGLTPPQLALAWVLGQGPDIVPIPGTRSVANLEANARAADVTLDSGVTARLDRLFPVGAVQADRYPPGYMERVSL